MRNKNLDLQKLLQPYSLTKFLLKEKMKSKNQLKLKQKLKISNKLQDYIKTVLKVSTFIFRETFVFNETIYLDKVKENERANSLFLSCKHFFIDVRKNDIILVTKNLPEFGLYLGMKGLVERVLIHQRLEVNFFYERSLLTPWAKKELVKK